MTTTRDAERDDGSPEAHESPRRPPVVAMVVVGVVMAVTLYALFASAGPLTEVLLDEGESRQPAGTATFDLAGVTVAGELDTDWIRRERCPGWIQLNSMSGDATTLHVIATARVPDPATGRFEPVDDLPAWWADTIGVGLAEPGGTTLLDTPAVAGRLVARDGAPEHALLAACPAEDDTPGVGIKGPAAGFEQHVVATTEPVPGIGPVVVLGAAWVGGDIELATAEATRLAGTLARTDA